jgi:hypothetical protein
MTIAREELTDDVVAYGVAVVSQTEKKGTVCSRKGRFIARARCLEAKLDKNETGIAWKNYNGEVPKSNTPLNMAFAYVHSRLMKLGRMSKNDLWENIKFLRKVMTGVQSA